MKNRKIRVLFVEDDKSISKNISDNFKNSETIEIIAFAYNGKEAYEKILNLSPDVVVLDMVLPYLDGLGVLEKISEIDASILKKPEFIIIILNGQENLIKQASKNGVKNYLIKPYGFDTLNQKILTAFKENVNLIDKMVLDADFRNFKIEKVLSKILQIIGIPKNIKGYRYLRYSIEIAISNIDIIDSVTRELYPMIATRFNSTPSRVERSMRHAIEIAWKRGEIDFLEESFGYPVGFKKGRPTNSQFIAMIADQLRLEIIED